MPVIGVVQAGTQAMADRYTYVPLIGIFLLVVWGLGDLVVSWRRAAPCRGRSRHGNPGRVRGAVLVPGDALVQ